MFKEIADNIKETVQPMLKLPDFVDANRIPLDLVTAVAVCFGISKDTSKYIKFVQSKDEDFIYLVYRDLVGDKNTVLLFDNLLYKGKICHITIVDYDTAATDKSVNNALSVLFIMTLNAVLYIKAKNSDMFYRNTKRLPFIFDYAPLMIFMDVAMSMFLDSDELREGMLKLLNESPIEAYKVVDRKLLDSYIELIKDNGISLLLDSSMLAGALKEYDNSGDNKNEKATV